MLRSLSLGVFVACLGAFVACSPSKPAGNGGERALCESTGGAWLESACGHAKCGLPGLCTAMIPGCNCGEWGNFVAGEGCVEQRILCASAEDPGPGTDVDPDPEPGDGNEDPPAEEPECDDETDCEEGEVCVETTDPVVTRACEPAPRTGCLSSEDCAPGQMCLPTPGAPCPDPNDCTPPPGICVDTNTCEPVLCELYCEHGFATDPDTGCEVCRCAGVDECGCTDELAPVCGVDGETYPNACQAMCADVEIAYENECKSDCVITCIIPDPVCGADGVTYTCGRAEAECNGTTVAHDGPCDSDGNPER